MIKPIFEVNYYKWEIFDKISWSYPTINGSIWLKNTEKWLWVFSSVWSNNYLYTNSLNWIYSIVIFTKIIWPILFQKAIEFYKDGSNRLDIRATLWSWLRWWAWFWSWTLYADAWTNLTIKNKYQCVILSWTTIASWTTIRILSDSAWSSYKWYMNYVAIYQWTLTQTEINTIQKQFLSIQPIQPPKTNFPRGKNTIRENLIWSISFKPAKGKLYETITGTPSVSFLWSPTKDGVNFAYNKGFCSFGNILNISTFTICTTFTDIENKQWSIVWKGFLGAYNNGWGLYVTGTTWGVKKVVFQIRISWVATEYTIDNLTPYIRKTLVISRDWTTGQIRYSINWGAITTVSWVVWTISSSEAFTVWSSTGLNFKGNAEIENLDIYSSIFTDSQHSKYHSNMGYVVFKEDFSFEKADWNNVVPRGWIAGTGKYKVGTELTGNSIIKKGANYLQCTWAWTISFPLKQSYWSLEFTFNTSSILQKFKFINSWWTTWIYALDFSGAAYRIRLWRDMEVWSLFYTNTNYISTNTNYRMRITRGVNWSFSVYIKWLGFWNDYVLVSTTWGFWTNPTIDNTYSKSNFFTLDFWVWDIISDIVVKSTI